MMRRHRMGFAGWVMAGVVLFGMMGLTGCESGGGDEIDGVRFENDARVAVTVWWGYFRNMISTSFPLAPGEEKDIQNSVSDTVYYDWEPKDTVTANVVSKNHIVFVDKAP